MWDPLLLGIPHYVHHYMIATVGNYQQTPFVPGVLGATLRNGNMDFTKENWAVTAGLVLVGIWVAAPPSPPESHLLQS